MNAPLRASVPAGRAGLLSVLSISLTAALATTSHAYEFGPPAFLVGAAVIALLVALGLGYLRSRKRVVLVLYGLLSLGIIAGFGIVGGFWNHTVKVLLCAVLGSPLPASAEPWFVSLEPGPGLYEAAGILTFVASVAAAVHGYRFIRPGLVGGAGGLAPAQESRSS